MDVALPEAISGIGMGSISDSTYSKSTAGAVLKVLNAYLIKYCSWATVRRLAEFEVNELT